MRENHFKPLRLGRIVLFLFDNKENLLLRLIKRAVSFYVYLLCVGPSVLSIQRFEFHSEMTDFVHFMVVYFYVGKE